MSSPSAGDSSSLRLERLLDSLFLFVNLLLLVVVSLYHVGGSERILFRFRIGKDTGHGVIVFGRNRIVLVIVAARAGDRQAKEAASEDVHAVMTFVGARFGRFDNFVIPGTQREQTQSGAQRTDWRLFSSRSPAICALTNRSYGMSR